MGIIRQDRFRCRCVGLATTTTLSVLFVRIAALYSSPTLSLSPPSPLTPACGDHEAIMPPPLLRGKIVSWYGQFGSLTDESRNNRHRYWTSEPTQQPLRFSIGRQPGQQSTHESLFPPSSSFHGILEIVVVTVVAMVFGNRFVVMRVFVFVCDCVSLIALVYSSVH